jgi:MYXO-CTERM domain-containing protein
MKFDVTRTVLVVSSFVVAPAFGALQQWRVEDGGNGHYYDIMGGYLASLTSQAENDWLWNTFNIGGTPSYWAQTGPWPGYDGPVFGAYRNSSNVWSWVSGEAWSWSNFNWSMGSGEAGAQFIAQSRYWDDIGVNGGTSAGGNYSFVIEYDFNPVPAPGAAALLGLAGALGRRRRRLP